MRTRLVVIASLLAAVGSACTPCAAPSELKEIPGGHVCLVRDIGYPIIGTYLYEEVGEPIVRLDADGGGVFQLHGGTQAAMQWGVEAGADGVVLKNEGPAGAVFRLWYYQLEDAYSQTTGASFGGANQWDIVQLSVSFTEEKAYILGERVKPF